MPKSSTWNWRRFSLRAALILLTVLCIALGVLFENARRQRRAVEAILEAEGEVVFVHGFYGNVAENSLKTPKWLKGTIAEELFRTPVFVQLVGRQVTDKLIAEHVSSLDGVTELMIGGPRLTDNAAPHLARMTQLEGLMLFSPRLTDASLPHLARLETLTGLTINSEGLSPEGVAQLKPLRRLRYVRSIRDDRNEQLLSALQSSVMVDFHRVPPADAFAYLSDYLGIPIDLHEAIEDPSPVTFAVASQPLQDILQKILGPRELAYYFDAGTLVIAPEEVARNHRPGYHAFREALPQVERLEVDW